MPLKALTTKNVILMNHIHIQQRPPVDVFKKVLGNVSLKPGKVVSLTILTQKGFFQKNTQGLSGKSLMQKVCTSQIITITITIMII